jgi:hypothetical protein
MARGRSPTSILVITFPLSESSTVMSWSVSPVTHTTLPLGCSCTPSGSRPTGTVLSTLPLAISTMVAVFASSLETKSRVPSWLMSKASGSEPPGSTLVTLRLVTSITPMPSLDLSAFNFSHSSSGMVGGQRGEPLSAT